MGKKLFRIFWQNVKPTYPEGTSKHTNAILEQDFEKVWSEILNDYIKIELLNLLEDLSDYIPCEVYTKKIIQIKEHGLS